MSHSFENKVALVTGSSRGIGRSVAITLASRGAAFIGVHYVNDEAGAQEVVAEITRLGAKSAAMQGDLSLGQGGTAALWENFNKASTAAVGHGGIDILVNNAGGGAVKSLEETTEADFDNIMDLNVKATFFLVQAAAAAFREGGRIINVSTVGARLSSPMHIAYTSAKGAIEKMTLSMAGHFGSRQITVNAVAPGITETHGLKQRIVDPEVHAYLSKQSVMGRFGQPEDIADVICFLASEAGRWVTGQTIDVSGGTRI